MTTELHTLSGAFALDALSPEEAARFRTHLDACAACQEEVLELQAAAGQMGASEALTPPAHLRAHVLAAADREPQLPPLVRHREPVRDHTPAHTKAPRWTPRLLAAAAAVVLVVGAGIGFSQLQQENQPPVSAAVSRVFDAPDVHTSTVETSNGGEVELARSRSLGELAVDTDQLPALTDKQVYQMWAIRGDRATSVGLLNDPDRGAAMRIPGKGSRFAITIEPAGGSDAPTTDPIVQVDPTRV